MPLFGSYSELISSRYLAHRAAVTRTEKAYGYLAAAKLATVSI